MNKTAYIMHVNDSRALGGAEWMLVEIANAACRIVDTRNALSKVSADRQKVLRL